MGQNLINGPRDPDHAPFRGGLSYLCTKFVDSSFSRSRDMVGADQNLNGLRDLITPFQGPCVVRGLGLATVNQSSKFEVSNFTHYEDMKDVTKCHKWGGLGQLGITQDHCQSRHSIQRIRVTFSLPS